MDYYGKIAKGYDELYEEEQANKLSVIRDNINVSKSTKILDIGCGTGISSNLGCFVAGIDPSMELLRHNQSRRKVCGTAELLPFKNNSFDYVVCVTAMHNFDNINNSLEEMKRVCNGHFIITILKRSKKFNMIKRIIGEKFKVYKMKEESKDTLLFCRKP